MFAHSWKIRTFLVILSCFISIGSDAAPPHSKEKQILDIKIQRIAQKMKFNLSLIERYKQYKSFQTPERASEARQKVIENKALQQELKSLQEKRQTLDTQISGRSQPSTSNPLQSSIRRISSSIQTVESFNGNPGENRCPIIPQPQITHQTPTPIRDTTADDAISDETDESFNKIVWPTIPTDAPGGSLYSFTPDEDFKKLNLPSVPKGDPAIRHLITDVDNDVSIGLLNELFPILEKLKKYPKDRFANSEHMRLIKLRNELYQKITLERAENQSKVLQTYVPRQTKGLQSARKRNSKDTQAILTQAEVDEVKQSEQRLIHYKLDLTNTEMNQILLEQQQSALQQNVKELEQAVQKQRQNKTIDQKGLEQRYQEKRTLLNEKLREIEKKKRQNQDTIVIYRKEIKESADDIIRQTQILLLPRAPTHKLGP